MKETIPKGAKWKVKDPDGWVKYFTSRPYLHHGIWISDEGQSTLGPVPRHFWNGKRLAILRSRLSLRRVK